jgi:hypothetical protein
MTNNGKCRSGCIWAVLGVVVWLIINIRVEAGIGTPFERAVDGIVGGALLLTVIFLAWRFFDSVRRTPRE